MSPENPQSKLPDHPKIEHPVPDKGEESNQVHISFSDGDFEFVRPALVLC